VVARDIVHCIVRFCDWSGGVVRAMISGAISQVLGFSVIVGAEVGFILGE
jgi:hypothetical protein